MTADSKAEALERAKQRFDWANRIRSSKFFNDNAEDKAKSWGYDLYPERKKLFESSLLNIAKMKEGRETYDKLNCEKNVYHCAMNSPLVKTMMGALKAAGW